MTALMLAQSDQGLSTAGTDPGPFAILDEYLWVFLAALAVSFLLTPLMRCLAIRNGVVDQPDMKRKAHVEPIAYMGGVAIFLGWLTGVSLCFFMAANNPLQTRQFAFPLSVIVGAAAITITGLMDDVYGVSPRVKIGGQFFAAAALAWQNIGFSLVTQTFNIFGVNLPEPVAYVLGTAMLAAFVLGGCNAVNLIDGLDGLASGIVAIATLGFLFIAVTISTVHGAADPQPTLISDPVRIVMCLAILGAVLGFLPYNFNPANIFMGDAGSLLLGYLCVASILMFADPHMNNSPMYVMAALIVFALPIIDTALAIFRRKMSGKPIFSPDDQHLHHQILRAVRNIGINSPRLSVKLAVIAMYMLAGAFALLGCSLVFFPRGRYVIAVFTVFLAFIFVTAYKSGHMRQLEKKPPDAAGLAEAPASTQHPMPPDRPDNTASTPHNPREASPSVPVNPSA